MRLRAAPAFVVALLILSEGGRAQSPPNPLPRLRIVSPAEKARASGPTLLRAAVEPAGIATSVVFFADGRQICVVVRPPFECDWDAGPTIDEHQIRAVANLSGGDRIVETVYTWSPAADTSGPGPTFSVSVEAVQLTVTVREGDGRFVQRLPQSAFRVFEDGVPQSISNFVSEDVPLELVVAVDVSGSMAAAMPKLKTAVKEFLTLVPPRTSTTVLAFNDRISALATPSTNLLERSAGIDQLAAYGPTSLYDVVIRGVELVRRKTGRKALIIFTDGEDQGSRASLDEVERQLQTSDATLYMIGQGRGVELENLKKVMQRLVQPTGGRVLFTNRIDELRGAFAELLSEISHQYLIAYTPTDTRRDDRWRKIKVDVDGRHEVRTRQGYRLSSR